MVNIDFKIDKKMDINMVIKKINILLKQGKTKEAKKSYDKLRNEYSTLKQEEKNKIYEECIKIHDELS